MLDATAGAVSQIGVDHCSQATTLAVDRSMSSSNGTLRRPGTASTSSTSNNNNTHHRLHITHLRNQRSTAAIDTSNPNYRGSSSSLAVAPSASSSIKHRKISPTCTIYSPKRSTSKCRSTKPSVPLPRPSPPTITFYTKAPREARSTSKAC